MKKLLYSVGFLLFTQFAFSQQGKYYHKGDPKKWQAEITIPIWLPWVSGKIGVDGMLRDLESDIDASPSDLVSNMTGALMLNADISKGSFVTFANYMHVKLETEKAPARLPSSSATWTTKIKNDILDMAAGGRFHFNKGMVDSYFGVRYFNANTGVDLTRGTTTKSGSDNISFWDPFFGARLFYYPKDRLLLFLKTDFGGVWGGSSEFSWNIEGKIGYSVSPSLDLAGGFRTYSFKYEEATNNASIFYLNPHFYGFEITASILIPKRKRDGKVFLEKK